MTTLHITNGDCAAETIRLVVRDPVTIMADVLHEGPCPPIDGDAWHGLRADFLASYRTAAVAEVKTALARGDRAVTDACGNGDDIVLWFEHDLFDQLALIRTLDLIVRLKPDTTNPRTPTTTDTRTPTTTDTRTPATTDTRTPATTNPRTPATTNPRTPATTNPRTPANTDTRTPATTETRTPATTETRTPANTDTRTPATTETRTPATTETRTAATTDTRTAAATATQTPAATETRNADSPAPVTPLAPIVSGFSRTAPGVSLICIDRFPGIDRFVGLGQLSRDQIATLAGTGATVTAGHLALARDAWRAFRSSSPEELLEIALGLNAAQTAVSEGGPALPFLGDALLRFLAEYPSSANGLSRTEELALHALVGGERTGAALFAAVQAREAAPFMGDLPFFDILNRLASCRVPLVTVAAQPGGTDLRTRRIAITPAGRDVIAARADHVRLNGIDVWRGGVHLTGSDSSPWRWDGNSETLVS